MPWINYQTRAGAVGGGSPCWNKGAGCPARQAGCHAGCEQFAAWKAEAEKERGKQIHAAVREGLLNSHVAQSKRNFDVVRTHRTKGGGRHK